MPRRVQFMPLQMALIQELGEPAPGTFDAVMRVLSRRFRGDTPKVRDAQINAKLVEYAGNNPRTKKPYDVRTAQRWSQGWRAPAHKKLEMKKAGNLLVPNKAVLANLQKGTGLDVTIARIERLKAKGADVKMRATFLNTSVADRHIARHRTIGEYETVKIQPNSEWWPVFIEEWTAGNVGKGRQLCKDDPILEPTACDAFQEAFWEAMGGYSSCVEIYDVEYVNIYDGGTTQRRTA